MYNLERFIEAQEFRYEEALKEIKNGRKESCWMWYIFPQIKGLGISCTANYYAIKNIKEAKEYLNNKILKQRLIEISEALLRLEETNPIKIFGYIDSLKLKSSMTLFYYTDKSIPVFKKIIEKYYNNQIDEETLKIIETQKEENENI